MPDDSRSGMETITSITDVPEKDWNGLLAKPHPFLAHGFLRALEESGSAGPGAGWVPLHLILKDEGGQITGAAPLYAKNHSYGEYVFDHGWAEAYMRAGGRYYPKLQCSIPFTPATGPRLLARRKEDKRLLARAMRQACQQVSASSVHATFLEEREKSLWQEEGYLIRTGQQYHWENDGYANFDDFLASLSSRKRKTIRRERRDALKAGLAVRILEGAEIREAHWDCFYDFYRDTGARKWGTPYLNREFFSLAGEAIPESTVLILAERNGIPIAGALNFKSGTTLYGRYWGCREHHRFLHFELCYYQAIDYAIANGLSRVEAGAQGEHKIFRGYRPAPVWSAHWMRDPGLHDGVRRFLAEETEIVEHEAETLARYLPFRKGDQDGSED